MFVEMDEGESWEGRGDIGLSREIELLLWSFFIVTDEGVELR